MLLPPEPLPHLDAAARHHRTPMPTGSIAWREWGGGPPLVLLHGGTGTWRHWGANIARLAERHRVLAPDTPGLGQSDLPPEPASPESIASHLAAGIDALLGPESAFHIAGFSYGAMLAGIIAAARAPRALSLTLIGPGALGLPRANVVLEKVRSKSGPERLEAHRHNLGIFMLARPERIDAAALAIQEFNTSHARFKSKGFAHTTALRDALPGAPARLRVIWGEHDVTAAPSVDARIAVVRALRPDAAITVIPGAGHWTAWDEPEAVEAIIAT